MYNSWDIDLKEYPGSPKLGNFRQLFLLVSTLLNSEFTKYFYYKYSNITFRLVKNFYLKNKFIHKTIKSNNYNLSKQFKNIPTQPQYITIENYKTHPMLNLFKTFIRFSLPNGLNYFGKHSSLKYYYLSNSKNLLTSSLNKLYSKWINFYLLFFNIFYYNLNFITFSNSIFNKEITALNWNFFYNKPVYSLWRYIKPFIFFKLGQIVNYGPYLFRKLRLKDFNIGLVIDPQYHSKTLYYLNLCKFFTVSLTFSSSRPRDVDLSLPITTNSIFTQLFFVRLLFLIQKKSSKLDYDNRTTYWANLLKLNF